MYACVLTCDTGVDRWYHLLSAAACAATSSATRRMLGCFSVAYVFTAVLASASCLDNMASANLETLLSSFSSAQALEHDNGL